MTIMRERRGRALACGTGGGIEASGVEDARAGGVTPADGKAELETASRSASSSSALR